MGNFLTSTVEPVVLARARQGDMAAHGAIFRVYGGPVYTLARRLLGSPELADEVVQDTFIQVISSIRKFRGEAPLGAWIRRIAVNKCLMQLRGGWHSRRGEAELDAQPGDIPDVALALDVEKALDLLPPVSRAVMWLHEVEGYTHEEISRLMNKTPSFSKSQLARAYTHLRALLGDETEVETCMPISDSC